MHAIWKYAAMAVLACAVALGAALAQEKGRKADTTAAAFFIGTNDQLIALLQEPKGEKEGSAKAEAKIEATIRKLRSANEKLCILDSKLRDPKLASQYGKLLIEAIEIQGALGNDVEDAMSYNYPGYIISPIDGMIPIEDLPVNPPTAPSNPDECRQAGEAIKNDCMIAAEMLEDCGALDAGGKVAMQFSCTTAGQTEEMACNLAISTGGQHIPRDPDQRVTAEITCRNLEEQRGVGQPGQTQTSTGN